MGLWTNMYVPVATTPIKIHHLKRFSCGDVGEMDWEFEISRCKHRMQYIELQFYAIHRMDNKKF